MKYLIVLLALLPSIALACESSADCRDQRNEQIRQGNGQGK